MFIAAAPLAFTTGCASLFNKLVEKPKIDLDRVSVRDANLTGVTLLFIVKVANPNKVDIKVDEIAYKVFINGKEITKAKTEKTVLVPAEKTAEVEIPLPIEYTKIFSDLKDLLTSKTAQYRIEGDAKLAMFTIPFKKEGQIQVRGK
ncbi:MAG: LEA type 2 family protein [Bdellovibrionaceae bacterium]|nr:LEA type 2 family protein [Pseudobdellovibrionaceae bacterium]